MDERFKRQQEERDRFADGLAATYAADLPLSVTNRAFCLAWEHGHANGHGDVEAYFIDFVDLAGDAYRAGLRDNQGA